MHLIRYPSREEAMRCRAELQEAVEVARRDEQPEKSLIAWPAGLDRSLLLGLAVKNRTRLCLQRRRLACGEGTYTVAQFLHVRHLSPAVLRDLLLASDEFLRNYITTFDDAPGPADVAAMRLRQAVQSLTPTETAIVEQRLFTAPPVAYHELTLRFHMSTTRIRSRLREAQRRIEVALGPELRIIAAELKERLDASPDEGDIEERIDAERIDAFLDGVLPDHGDCTARRARALFRQALAKELSLQTRPSQNAPASVSHITPN